MKKWMVLFFFLPLLGFRCEKEITNECLKGKIVRITCASVVVQVLNNNSIGEDRWASAGPDGSIYDNVFMIENRCQLNFTPEVGKTFYFNIGEKVSTDDCMICMLWDAPPKVKLTIKNISEVPCSGP